jgi:hypothetical protein
MNEQTIKPAPHTKAYYLSTTPPHKIATPQIKLHDALKREILIVIVHGKLVQMEASISSGGRKVKAITILKTITELRSTHQELIINVGFEGNIHAPPPEISSSFNGVIIVGGAWYGGVGREACVDNQNNALQAYHFKSSINEVISMPLRA